MCDRIDEIMLGNVRYEGMPMQRDTTTGEYGKLPTRTFEESEGTLAYRRIDDLQLDPLFLGYMQHPVFREITEALIGPNVSIFRAMFMNKPAEHGTHLPWHQDVGIGWGLDSNPEVTVWTALDAATIENGCMQVVPRSHKHGVINEMHFPSEADQARYARDEDCIHMEAAAGEAILLNNLLLHRSARNPTGKPRRAISIAYMDAATHAVKTGETFPVIFGEGALTGGELIEGARTDAAPVENFHEESRP
ncbi:MAG: phytanoyl-CoA dioxygenase family protein, partial [Gemmatimonadetes bacterium]|nr:phytanoyl-CoA dioxygenase family protein [Gemmatimonadota bacterium]